MMGMTACDVIDEQDYIKNNGSITPPEHPEPDPGETGDFTTSKCVLNRDLLFSFPYLHIAHIRLSFVYPIV